MSSPLSNPFWNLIRPQNWHIEEHCNHYGNFQVLVLDIVKMHPLPHPLVSCCLVAQSCPTLQPHGLYVARQGTSVHGDSPGWVAMPASMGSSHPRDRTQVSHIAGGFFTI